MKIFVFLKTGSIFKKLKPAIMKQFFYLLVLFSINFTVAKTQDRAPVGEDWKLTDEDKNGMLERLNECGLFKPCNNKSKVIDPDNENYKWILANYSNSAEISLVEARYRHEDIDRYRSMRGIEDSRKYKVQGYKTVLVKVVLLTGSMVTITNYYDIFTIKPPPND